MNKTYLITGNKNKLRELQQIFPDELNLAVKELDLTEIQNLDLEEILEDKLRRAYAEVNSPVIAEDVSVELAWLNGLPGPFAKFFFKQLGRDALWHMAKDQEDKSVTAICTMGYYDGKNFVIERGEVKGQIVSPRGENGFGFDYTFMPDGFDKTTAEMTSDEKNRISWRAIAARKLSAKLKN